MIEIEKEDHVSGSAMAHTGWDPSLSVPFPVPSKKKKKKVIVYNKMYGVVENLLTSGF